MEHEMVLISTGLKVHLPAHLNRGLQSEEHLAVFPADLSPI